MDHESRIERAEQDLRFAEEETVSAHVQARLQALPLLREHRIELQDFAAKVREFGDVGHAPLVLLHGLGTDWRFWLDTIGPLAERYRVLVLELRHHGDAAAAPAATTLDDYAGDVAATLDALQIERAAVVGLSMGGAVAQHFAIRYPRRLAELWLMATLSKGVTFLLDRAAAAEAHGVESQVATTLLRWFTPTTLAANGFAVRYARSTIRQLSVPQWAASWRALATTDSIRGLPHITAPVHVVAGEMDISTTPEMMRGMASMIPSARFSIIPGAAHMLALEAPRVLVETLLRA